MNKYIIELRPDCKVVQQICESNGQVCVGARSIQYLEELNSDYINEHFGSLQDMAYQRGLEEGKKAFDLLESERNSEYQRGLDDAWKLAEDVLYNRGNVLDILRCATVGAAFDKYSAGQALDILKAYEEKQKADDEIKVGDIVERYLDDKLDSTGIYLGDADEKGDYWNCLFWTGASYITLGYPKNQFKKTGRHFDIEKLLEGIKHD